MHICKKFNEVIIITLLNMFYCTMYYSLVCCGLVAWLGKCTIYILLYHYNYVISKNNTEREKGTYILTTGTCIILITDFFFIHELCYKNMFIAKSFHFNL